MSRLAADLERCVGAGACEAAAPDVFEVGDEGTVLVLRPRPADADLPDVRAAVRACPTGALRLVTEQPDPGEG